MLKLYLIASKCLHRTRVDPEVARYIISGVFSNMIGYLVYLLLTMLLGIGHKTAMTGLYAVGTIVNFYVNRRWTFRGTGSIRHSLARFLLVIILGYFINLAGLIVFVDSAGLPHELVQACATTVMAAYFFIVNKHYVHAN